MAVGKVAAAVEKITAPIVESLGMELIEVEYVKEGPSWYLRLYIDKRGGVSIDDCQLVSESVSDAIDAADPISGTYIFEVSSPGLDRPLKTQKDFERYEGELVEVGLYAPLDGVKSFEGKLVGKVDGEIIIVNESGKELRFEEKLVSLVKRAIRF